MKNRLRLIVHSQTANELFQNRLFNRIEKKNIFIEQTIFYKLKKRLFFIGSLHDLLNERFY